MTVQPLDILAASGDGNPIIVIDQDTGYVGIGTQTPDTALDILGTVTATAVAATTITGTITATAINGAFTNTANVGTANTGVTAVENGDGKNHVTTLTFTDLTIGAAVGAANLAFGKLLYTLPAGVQNYSVAYMDVTLTGTVTIAADTPDVGIGTVIGAGAVAVLGGTATFEDIITGQTSGAIDGTNAIIASDNTVDVFRLTADAKTVHLNVADGWAGAGTVTATGTIVIQWTTII